ncbi:MAG: hypothetical protein ACRDLB_06905 [Actinomycetota bacterium]
MRGVGRGPIRSGRRVRLAIFTLIFAALPIAAAPAAGSQAEQVRPATWEMVSVASNGAQGDHDSGTACGHLDGPSMSDDSRYVVFSSEAGNLDPRDLNGSALSDVFVHDRQKDTTDLVSLTPQGALPGGSNILGAHCSNGESLLLDGAHDPEISANGRFVAFSDQRPMTDDDEDVGPPGADDVFVRDLRKGTTELLSMTTSGEQIKGDHGFFAVSISGNGRFVAFTSSVHALDEDLADQDEIDKAIGEISEICVDPAAVSIGCPQQIFVRDRKKDTLDLVSVSDEGVPANRNVDLDNFQISDDGRYVVFASSASNLDPDETNQASCPTVAIEHKNCQDVFLRDLKAGTTELISVDSQEETGAGNSSLPVTNAPVITPGGRYVVFDSFAPLAPSTDLGSKVYVRDRKTGRTEQIAVSSAGELMPQGASASISDDGRYVFFTGTMDPGTVGCSEDIGCTGEVRYDRRTGQADWIWSGAAGAFGSSIGSTGRTFLRWSSDDQPYVAGDANEAMDIFVGDVGAVGLGVGRLATGGSGRGLTKAEDPTFDRTGVSQISDPRGDLLPDLDGADIVNATLAHRPDLTDLYVRIDVEDLTALGVPGVEPLTSRSLVWGLELTANEVRYEVRMTGGIGPGVLGRAPGFDLFRCRASTCTKSAELRGGFGTTGESMVAALPLELIGLEEGGEISDVEAFTALVGPRQLQPLDVAAFRR